MVPPTSHSDFEGSAERAGFICSHAPSQVVLAAASACRLRAPRRTVEAPARAWPHGETHGFACHSGCTSRLVASDGFAAIAASAHVRGCHWQRLVVRPAAATSRAASAIDESNFRLARSLCDSCRVAVSDGVVARPHRAELSGRARGCAHAAVRLLACAGRCGQPGRAIGPIGRIG